MAYLLLLVVAVGYLTYKYSEKRSSVGLDGMWLLTKYNLFRYFVGALVGAVALIVGGSFRLCPSAYRSISCW